MPSMWGSGGWGTAQCEAAPVETGSQQAELNAIHDKYPEPEPNGLAEKAMKAMSMGDKDNVFGGRNPLVPFGCLATGVVLCRGIFAMYTGDKHTSQKMMRGRILAQGVTVITIAVGAVVARTSAQRKKRAEEDMMAITLAEARAGD